MKRPVFAGRIFDETPRFALKFFDETPRVRTSS